MPDAQKIIDLAKKLQAMTGSPNVNEASVAAEKLQELLLRHNVELWELGGDKVYHNYFQQEFNLAAGGVGDDKTWKRVLLTGIGEANACRVICWTGTTKAAVYGQSLNITVCRHMYAYLASEVMRLERVTWDGAKHRPSRKGHARAFYYGAVNVLAKRLKNYNLGSKEQTNSALVYINQTLSELDAIIAEFVGPIKSLATGGAVNKKAYDAGKAAAKNINLDKHINGGGASPAINTGLAALSQGELIYEAIL